MEPVTTYVSETVYEHPGGDTESFDQREHDYDLLHDPPSMTQDGPLHPGNDCTRVQCTHFGRCPHGQPNRCLVCGSGPFAVHPFDWYVCQHSRPCQHRSQCQHTHTETRMVACRHLTTRQRPLTEMRPVERQVRVAR